LPSAGRDDPAKRAEEALRAFEKAGGYSAIQRRNEDALRAFQDAGGLVGIQERAEDALRAFQDAGGFTAIQQRAEDALAALEQAGGFGASQRRAEDALRAFRDAGGFEAVAREALDADPAVVAEDEVGAISSPAVSTLDHLIGALLLALSELAADVTFDHTRRLILHALVVLLTVRAVIVELRSSRPD
jgi:hypothetical protein